MQLLLIKDVRRVGHVGDVVEVGQAFARNFLLPQRMAVEPTAENIKAIESEKRRAAEERARLAREFQQLVERLKDASVTIEAAANPEGTLYGSVGRKEIAAALHKQGFEVLPEHVALDSPIRTLDNVMVNLHFTDDIATQVKVWVVREGAVNAADQPGSDQPSPPQA